MYKRQVRVQFAPGQQGWIGLAVLSILSGAVETLPVADPRSIPYGGFDTPRAGLTGATSSVSGRLAQSGLRIRSGPSTNYVILANAPRYSVMPVLGRTADNRWVQLNFEGTLGWAAAEYFEFSSPDVFALPIDGICADAVPLSEGGDSGFFDTLRFLRDRLDLAQPSLDAIRAIWTNVALGGVAQCGNYPIRPTDYNIPQPLLAAYVDRLGPLGTDFNLAMGSIRAAVELLIEACSFAQPSAGSVGQSVVQQALDAVRVIGNNAVHPGHLDLRDDQQTVAALFRLVNIITEQMITAPRQAQEVFDLIPQVAKDGIAKRDGSAP